MLEQLKPLNLSFLKLKILYGEKNGLKKGLTTYALENKNFKKEQKRDDPNKYSKSQILSASPSITNAIFIKKNTI